MSKVAEFARMIDAIKKFASGDLSARTNLPHDETDIGLLASALDEMFESVAARESGMMETYEACELIFEFNPLAIGIYDPQGRQIKVNRKMCEMLGYSEAELAQIDPTHPDDKEEGLRLFRELIEGKRESYQREKRYIRKDGTIIWADLTAAVVRDRPGKARYIVIMVQDITERKQ